jgi:pyridoxamine 5'-phosphate oxidase-like protein
MTNEDLFGFIKEQWFAVLSTVNENNSPEAALVGIAVTPDLEIVFDTLKTSRKYANLRANAAAAFVVGCTGDKTLQYEGTASEPTARNWRAVRKCILRSFQTARAEKPGRRFVTS